MQYCTRPRNDVLSFDFMYKLEVLPATSPTWFHDLKFAIHTYLSAQKLNCRNAILTNRCLNFSNVIRQIAILVLVLVFSNTTS